MTQVYFYILGGQNITDQWLFACRLTQKAVRKGNNILLQVDNEQQAKELSDLLWCHHPEAFIPHSLSGSSQADPDNSPGQVCINWHTDPEHQDFPAHQHDVLINLSGKIPDFFGRFYRFIEVVVQHDDVLDYTRKHYKFLKDRGYPITHEDMRLR